MKRSFSAAILTIFFSLFCVSNLHAISYVPEVLKAGESVRFTFHGHSTGCIKWTFGDGRTQSGGTSINHTYRNPGTFSIRAEEQNCDPPGPLEMPRIKTTSIVIDPAGDSGSSRPSSGRKAKTIAKAKKGTISIQPGKLREGETATLTARGFKSSCINWVINGVKVQSRSTSTSHKFRKPGRYTIKMYADCGKILSGSKKVTVSKVNRSLKASKATVKVGEEVRFQTGGFLSNCVKWDFKDGTKKIAKKTIKHRFKRTGKFVVNAWDQCGGKGVRPETVRITVVDSGLKITRVDIKLKNGNSKKTFHLREVLPAQAVIYYKNRGMLVFQWLLDKKPIGGVGRHQLTNGGKTTLNAPTKLLTNKQGSHKLSLKILQYKEKIKIPHLTYMVQGELLAGAIPEAGQRQESRSLPEAPKDTAKFGGVDSADGKSLMDKLTPGADGSVKRKGKFDTAGGPQLMPKARIIHFYFSPDTITLGEKTTLHYNYKDTAPYGNSISGHDFFGTLPSGKSDASGTFEVTPKKTGKVGLVVYNQDETWGDAREAYIVVRKPNGFWKGAKPKLHKFSASPLSIRAYEKVDLTMDFEGCTEAYLLVNGSKTLINCPEPGKRESYVWNYPGIKETTILQLEVGNQNGSVLSKKFTVAVNTGTGKPQMPKLAQKDGNNAMGSLLANKKPVLTKTDPGKKKESILKIQRPGDKEQFTGTFKRGTTFKPSVKKKDSDAGKMSEEEKEKIRKAIESLKNQVVVSGQPATKKDDKKLSDEEKEKLKKEIEKLNRQLVAANTQDKGKTKPLPIGQKKDDVDEKVIAKAKGGVSDDPTKPKGKVVESSSKAVPVKPDMKIGQTGGKDGLAGGSGISSGVALKGTPPKMRQPGDKDSLAGGAGLKSGVALKGKQSPSSTGKSPSNKELEALKEKLKELLKNDSMSKTKKGMGIESASKQEKDLAEQLKKLLESSGESMSKARDRMSLKSAGKSSPPKMRQPGDKDGLAGGSGISSGVALKGKPPQMRQPGDKDSLAGGAGLKSGVALKGKQTPSSSGKSPSNKELEALKEKLKELLKNDSMSKTKKGMGIESASKQEKDLAEQLKKLLESLGESMSKAKDRMSLKSAGKSSPPKMRQPGDKDGLAGGSGISSGVAFKDNQSESSSDKKDSQDASKSVFSPQVKQVPLPKVTLLKKPDNLVGHDGQQHLEESIDTGGNTLQPEALAGKNDRLTPETMKKRDCEKANDAFGCRKPDASIDSIIPQTPKAGETVTVSVTIGPAQEATLKATDKNTGQEKTLWQWRGVDKGFQWAYGERVTFQIYNSVDLKLWVKNPNGETSDTKQVIVTNSKNLLAKEAQPGVFIKEIDIFGGVGQHQDIKDPSKLTDQEKKIYDQIKKGSWPSSEACKASQLSKFSKEFMEYLVDTVCRPPKVGLEVRVLKGNKEVEYKLFAKRARSIGLYKKDLSMNTWQKILSFDVKPEKTIQSEYGDSSIPILGKLPSTVDISGVTQFILQATNPHHVTPKEQNGSQVTRTVNLPKSWSSDGMVDAGSFGGTFQPGTNPGPVCLGDPYNCEGPKIAVFKAEKSILAENEKVRLFVALSNWEQAVVIATDKQTNLKSKVWDCPREGPGESVTQFIVGPLQPLPGETVYQLIVYNPYTKQLVTQDLEVSVEKAHRQLSVNEHGSDIKVKPNSQIEVKAIVRGTNRFRIFTRVYEDGFHNESTSGKVLYKSGNIILSKEYTQKLTHQVESPTEFILETENPGDGSKDVIKRKVDTGLLRPKIGNPALVPRNGWVPFGGHFSVQLFDVQNVGLVEVQSNGENEKRYSKLISNRKISAKKHDYIEISSNLSNHREITRRTEIRFKACNTNEDGDRCIYSKSTELRPYEKVSLKLPVNISIKKIPKDRFPVRLTYMCNFAKGVIPSLNNLNTNVQVYADSKYYRRDGNYKETLEFNPVVMIEKQVKYECQVRKVKFGKNELADSGDVTGATLMPSKVMYKSPVRGGFRYGYIYAAEQGNNQVQVDTAEAVNVTVEGYWKCQGICIGKAPGEK